jgi:photosystem II stability/assembly factor-like uncharacterized protein
MAKSINAIFVLSLIGVATCSGILDPPGNGHIPLGLPAATDSVRWEPIAGSPASPQGTRHDDVFFTDLSNGWIANTRGEIYRTDNGGTSWTLVHSSAGVFYRAIGFVTPMRGWVGNLNRFNSPTPRNSLFETTDGGVTWTNITNRVDGPDPVGLCGFWVASATHIYGVGRWNGPAVFVRTRDGGQTWTSRSLAGLATGLIDVFFFDENVGIAVGGDGVGSSAQQQAASRAVVLRTEDGGDSWERVYHGTTPGQWIWKISFPTADVGYVSIQGPDLIGTVLKSTDGGRTWAPVSPVGEPLGFSAIGFVTPDSGWVASDDMVFSTIDGGRSWRRAGILSNMNRIRFFPNGTGIAVGDRAYRFER